MRVNLERVKKGRMGRRRRKWSKLERGRRVEKWKRKGRKKWKD